jgi:hypothetical protein
VSFDCRAAATVLRVDPGITFAQSAHRTDIRIRSMTEPEWVQVANCNFVHEALFKKSVLASEGIDAQIPDEHVLGLQPFYANALGGVRVLVRSDQLQRATELLESVLPPEP